MTPFSFTGLKVFFSNSCRSIFPSLYTQISGMIPVEQAKEVLTCLYRRHNLPDLVLDLTLKSFIKPGHTGLTTEDLVEVMRSLDETINNSKKQVAPITEEEQCLSGDGSSSSPSPSLNDDRRTPNIVEKGGNGSITEQELNQAPDLCNLDRSCPNLRGKCIVKFEEDQLLSKDQGAAQIKEEKQGLSRNGSSSSRSLKDDRRNSSTVDKKGDGRITAEELNQPPDLLLVDPNLSEPNLCSDKLCFVKTRNMDPMFEEDQLLSKDQVAAQITEEKWGLSQDGLSSSPSLKDDRCSSNVVEKDGDGMFPVEHVKKALTCLYPGPDLPNLDITLKSFIKPGNTSLTSEDLVAVMRLLEETIINSKKQAAPITEEEPGLITIPAKLASAATTVWAKLKWAATTVWAKLKWAATLIAGKLLVDRDLSYPDLSGNRELGDTTGNPLYHQFLTVIRAKLASAATTVGAKLNCLATLIGVTLNRTANSIATTSEYLAQFSGRIAISITTVLTLVNEFQALTRGCSRRGGKQARNMSLLSKVNRVTSISLAIAKLATDFKALLETAGYWTMPIWKPEMC